MRTTVLAAFVGGLGLEWEKVSAAQAHKNVAFDSSGTANERNAGDNEQIPPTQCKLNEIIDRMIQREHDEIAAFDLYSPIMETYIQEVKPDAEMGIVPSSDYYFLGQADFRGRLKVHSMTESSRKGSCMWSFDPPGFLQMIYIDRGEFDKAHYRFVYSGREFLGEVRCLVFDVSPAPKVRGARFAGRIWVEDQDFTVVRINGRNSPPVHFSLRTFEDEYYLHFDSWRTNMKSRLWLPTYVSSQDLNQTTRFSSTSYKSSTHF